MKCLKSCEGTLLVLGEDDFTCNTCGTAWTARKILTVQAGRIADALEGIHAQMESYLNWQEKQGYLSEQIECKPTPNLPPLPPFGPLNRGPSFCPGRGRL